MSFFGRDPFYDDVFNNDPFFARDPFFDRVDRMINDRFARAMQDMHRAFESSSTTAGALEAPPTSDATKQEQAMTRTTPHQQQLWSPTTITAAPFLRSVRLDVSETPTSYLIHADLPGVSKDQLNITLKDDVLTISGERKDSREIKDEQRHVVERSYGRFSRSVRLPVNADAENVAARLDEGVLEVTVGKREVPKEEAPKRISIQ
ncbi:hypothetical protein HDU96_001999 [Phlyctochytrium bullatum]|nr:hypothetical protein HDU96_001999 [Phlyctochytrium bullatum]